MSGFSKLGITLTSVFSLLLLTLLAELLYRRRQHSHRRRTRVEPTPGPTSNSSSIRDPPDQLLKLEGIYSYGPSRVLFTIKEEEREEDVESGEGLEGQFGDLDFHLSPPFLTPCASPPYYTPSSSPSREKQFTVGT